MGYMNDLKDVIRRIMAFRKMRDWEKYHDPKNLAEGISIEAGELLEHFLWKTTDESRELTEADLKRISEEIADIFVFLVYLSEELGIDLLPAVLRKIEINERKYPVDKAKGSSKKYTDLD